MASINKIQPEHTGYKLSSFLEDFALHYEVQIEVPANSIDRGDLNYKIPKISLYCSNDDCRKVMFYKCDPSYIRMYRNETNHVHLEFTCKNCDKVKKEYFVRFRFINNSMLYAFKVGENPPRKINIPTNVQNFLEDDKKHLFKALKAESMGLGIAASAYYRRVVESQKNKLLNKVIEIARAQNFSKDDINLLVSAKDQNQFSKTFDTIKIPDSLLLKGQNPFKLLYKALSEDIHEMDDEIALKRAEATRKILIPFVSEIKRILKDDAEMGEAITILNNLKN